MTRGWLALLLVVAAVGSAAAGEDEPAALAPEQAADAVLEAFAEKDDAALRALAEKDDPDPWFVADQLCFRGAHDAAEAFARAAPRKAVDQLPAYVTSRRDRDPDPAAHRALAAASTAMRAGNPRGALAATEVAEESPTSVARLRLAFLRGRALRALRRHAESAAVFVRAGAAAKSLGWLMGADRLHYEAGTSAYGNSDWGTAIGTWTKCLALSDELGDLARVAWLHVRIGNVHHRLGALLEAQNHWEKALDLSRETGSAAGMARALNNIGVVHHDLGAYAEALRTNERALALFEEIGDRRGAAKARTNIGNAHCYLGAYAKALAFHEQARTFNEELGRQAGVAKALGNIGLVHQCLGAYAEALSFHERSLAMKERVGDRGGMATTLSNIGSVYYYLGAHAQALSHHKRALALSEEIGDRAGIARALANTGNVHLSRGANAEALAAYERALALAEGAGDRMAISQTLGNIGILCKRLGAYGKALSCQDRSLALAESIGAREQVASALGNIGLVHSRRGDFPTALSFLGRAVREARRLRARDVLVTHLMNRAKVFLADAQPGRALSAAQKALMEAEGLLGGLGEEEGASARERLTNLFAVGTLAAARLEEPAEALTFLESGRAGALLETLGGRRALRWTDLPEELSTLDAEAQAAERRARWAYGRALDSGKRREVWKARRALDEATERIREVSARIQREAKKQAGLFYPRAATLEEIQGWLEDDEVLVLYGLCLDEALAMVVTHDGERIVSLGTADGVRTACEALLAQARDTNAAVALEHLRALLVKPLDLHESAKTVLISPEGPLCYVPFGALFDRPVACTPSGTTHVLLMAEERDPGRQILALGDPDYGVASDPGAAAIYRGGVDLVPLPGTREEATTIGDVVLLGTAANETKLRETLAREKRWRAVHLACHGLVDPERPTLSSLALTRAEEEDGYLTALEVLRMEIPADLAVLSACETAKGKIVGGEGIVGLTRCFMYAGAPRVLCSLWKVDDEATRALMTKFYELWNPAGGVGRGAAEALKQAQAFVRGHEKWKHPYYWAAWVLWGLPG